MKLNLKRFKPVQMELEAYIEKLKSRGLAPDGRQVPDATPMAPPIGYKKQPSMVEIVRQMVQSERLKQEAAAQGMESFEESEDFEVEDDFYDGKTQYTNDFDPPIKEIAAEVENNRKSKKAAKEPETLTDKGGGEGGIPPSDAPKEP